MKKILYITSTLRRAGPTYQLYNLIKYLDREAFEPHLLTLSPEPFDSYSEEFLKLGINIKSLQLSRIDSFLYAKKKIKLVLKEDKPDIIHSQGIRPDLFMSKVQTCARWFITSHTCPHNDYPMKFGKFRGMIMTFQHINAMRKCKNVIACSNSLFDFLSKHKVISTSIQNGVDFKIKPSIGIIGSLPKPIFITVGSLVVGKNVHFIIDAFNIFKKQNIGSLVVLGDGPQLQELKIASTKDTYFYGNVPNVPDYLADSDYFISASLSEGFPNSVLEALTSGLPALLSDIPSHLEIAQEYHDGCSIYSLEKGPQILAQQMENVKSLFPNNNKIVISNASQKIFSAQAMSEKYQNLYLPNVDINK